MTTLARKTEPPHRPAAILPTEVGACLVVDDNMFDRRMMRRCLAHDRPDLSLYECETITAARDFLRVRKPDVILLDHRLPDGQGLDFAKELRADPAMADTMVCVVTSVDTRLLEPGVPALSKDDLTPQTLWNMVSDFLTARRVAHGSEAGQLVEQFGSAMQDTIAPILTKMLRTLRSARAQLGAHGSEGADDALDRLDGMLLSLGDMLTEGGQGRTGPLVLTDPVGHCETQGFDRQVGAPPRQA